VKRTGKRTWRPERVVFVAEGGGGISEGVVVGVAVVEYVVHEALKRLGCIAQAEEHERQLEEAKRSGTVARTRCYGNIGSIGSKTYVIETSVSTTTWTSADANSEQDLQGSSATSEEARTDCITSINKVMQPLISRTIV
jgi:hypothetical protein